MLRASQFCLLLIATAMAAGCATAPTPGELFRNRAAVHGDRAVVVFGVPDLPRRTGPEDGARMLADLAMFWQKPLSYSNAATMMATRGKLSVEEALVANAETLGLWAFSLYGSPEEIVSKLRSGVPVVVLLQDGTNIESRRFSVVVGFDDVSKQFLCHDGAPAAAICDYDQFVRKWIPVRQWMAVICPPEMARWPMSAQDLCARARFYASQGQLPAARRDFESALATQPTNDEIKYACANILQESGEFDHAATLFRELRAKNPDDTRIANNLAFVLAKSGKSLDEAERIARSVVQREPANPAALDTLGYVLTLRDNFSEAIPLLEKAYDRAQVLGPRAQREIAVHLALAYMGDRREQMMKKIVNEIMDGAPDFVLPDELKKKINAP